MAEKQLFLFVVGRKRKKRRRQATVEELLDRPIYKLTKRQIERLNRYCQLNILPRVQEIQEQWDPGLEYKRRGRVTPRNPVVDKAGRVVDPVIFTETKVSD